MHSGNRLASFGMGAADYPLKILNPHLQRAYPQGLPPRSAILELGPGDSIASAVIACAYGVKHTYLVDVGSFASKNVVFYHRTRRGDGQVRPRSRRGRGGTQRPR